MKAISKIIGIVSTVQTVLTKWAPIVLVMQETGKALNESLIKHGFKDEEN